MIEVNPGKGKSVVHRERRSESPAVGDDVNKLMEDGGSDDQDYVVMGKLVHEKAPHPDVMRRLWHVSIDQNVGVDSSPHDRGLESSPEKISS